MRISFTHSSSIILILSTDRSLLFVLRLGSIAEFMNYEQADAFIRAVQDVYGIDLTADPEGPILKDVLRYGKSK